MYIYIQIDSLNYGFYKDCSYDFAIKFPYVRQDFDSNKMFIEFHRPNWNPKAEPLLCSIGLESLFLLVTPKHAENHMLEKTFLFMCMPYFAN